VQGGQAPVAAQKGLFSGPEQSFEQ